MTTGVKYIIPYRKPQRAKPRANGTPCPGCNRLLRGPFGLAQHRSAKGH